MRLALIVVASLALSSCATEALSVTLTPASPEIEVALLAADARWETAGVAPDRIIVGPGGAPVGMVVGLGSVPLGTIHGMTYAHKRGSEYTGVSAVDLVSLAPHVVVHELGHVLGIAVGFGPHPGEGTGACAIDNPNRPVMCPTGGPAITELDLDAACSAGTCTHFTPEW
jgi:hypothetical protein